MSNKAIVLDANILTRAVLGTRVRELIVNNAQSVPFFAPYVAFVDARKYLPALLEKRGVKSELAMTVPAFYDATFEYLKEMGLRVI